MYCKICFDTCKPGYDTHNVRDRFGNVLCPVLLSTKCPKCGKNGHTAKYCKNKVVSFDQTVKNISKEIPCLKTLYNYNNTFAVLCDDDTSDDNQEYSPFDMIYDLDDIIWGVGQKSMIGVSWADACGA